MAESIARVATPSASRYLQQLCKHWSHKFEVSFDPATGRIALPPGPLTLTAEPDSLVMSLNVADAATLDRMEPVVTEHLQRFAFRDALDVVWTRT